MNDKNPNRNILKAGVWYTLGSYFIKGITFLTIPIFSRIITTSDYGLYNTYISYATLLTIFITFAMHVSLKNAKIEFGVDINGYASSCIMLACLSLIAWLFLCNIFYEFYSSFFGFSRFVINLLIVQSFGSSIIVFFNSFLALSYGYKAFLKVAAINALSSIFLSVFFVSFIFKNNAYFGMIIGHTIPICLIAIYIIWDFFKKSKPMFNKEHLKFALRYSLPIIPHGIGQVIISQFDRVMINSMIGPYETGIYSFAYNIYLLIDVTAKALDNVWSPWFFEKRNSRDFDSIRKYSTFYLSGMALFTAIILLISPELILLLGTKKYIASTAVVIPILIGGFFSFLYTLPAQIEYYHKKTHFIALGTGLAAVLNIVLNAIYIKKYGYIAAAYTTFVTYLIYFLLHHYIAWKLEGKFLFSNKATIFCSLLVFVTGFLSFAFMQLHFIRWGLAIITVILAVLFYSRRNIRKLFYKF